MNPGPEPDADDYRFADRYVAARQWALAAALADRLPGMHVSQVVDAARTPLLVVHDADEQERVQLDLSGWVLYGASTGRVRQLYGDEVFALPLADVVEQVAAATGPVADDGSEARRAAYRVIARTLAEGLADDPGWLVQCVRIGGRWSAETRALLAQFPAGEWVAHAALDAAPSGTAEDGEPFREPLWVLRRGLEPAVLVDASTGRVHARDGSWRPADGVGTSLDDVLARAAEGRDLAGAIPYRQALASQWSCLELPDVVDPVLDVVPIRYGHVRAEAWRIVAALVAARADVRVVGPRSPGEICRMVDADGRTRVCLTADAIFVDAPDVGVLDWWDVFAAPFPSSIPETLLTALPVLPVREDGGGASGAGASGAARTYQVLAQVLAAAVDDDVEWRVLQVAAGRWLVVRMLEIVAVLDEREAEAVVGTGWVRRKCPLEVGRGAA